MKLVALVLLAVATVTLVSACADDSDAQYSPSQIAAQHSDFETQGRTSTRHY